MVSVTLGLLVTFSLCDLCCPFDLAVDVALIVLVSCPRLVTLVTHVTLVVLMC